MRITDFSILSEIKEEYRDIRQKGASRDTSEEAMMQKYRDELTLGKEDDALLFWVALADAQYFCKELSSQVASNALQALEKIEQSDWDITPGDIVRRKERYAQAPMPERKKFGKPRRFRCSWKIGDTFAYKMAGQEAEAYGLNGKYMLFRKVDESETSDGHLFPIMTVSVWHHDELPRTSQEFCSVPILKLSSGRFQLPKDLFEYRVELLIKNAKQVADSGLQYIGNFSDVPMPEDEVIIQVPGCTKMLSLENLNIRCCNFWRNHHIYEQWKMADSRKNV